MCTPEICYYVKEGNCSLFVEVSSVFRQSGVFPKYCFKDSIKQSRYLKLCKLPHGSHFLQGQTTIFMMTTKCHLKSFN